eukprot:GHVU01139496.1.p1 GENE.GHVU01139496.1~~GHVU01139496.1.p1  ORF type:complete len:622 (-),score=41.72 GHVU01139496.1:28-1893(-)
MANLSLLQVLVAIIPLLAPTVAAGSLADIEHVILFMQENRAFDHYFGSMAGVRGFSDPNVQVNPHSQPSVFFQDVNSTLTNSSNYLLPWYLNYLGGDFLNATQCMIAGDNGWQSNHASLNGGLNDKWALNNTPWSWGHFRRSDLPIHFAIADAFTVGDMYQESVIASTSPNRVVWASGSINAPGSPQNASQGGNPYIDNNEIPGCDFENINCFPLSWKTVPEFYQASNVSWQVFQDVDNFDDNPLAWFSQYMQAANGSALSDRGMAFLGLEDFYARAANGTLPAVSYIIGPAELSEHQPYLPRDGAWLQKQVYDAVTTGKNWNTSALIISYDETGGYGDHVTPYHSPNGTAGEWIQDPYGNAGFTFTGPGFRLPFYIISPWTNGGKVFTEHADHNSQILFVENWLAAKGFNVMTDQMVPWRRQHMSNLTNAFDFDNPNYTVSALPDIAPPSTDAQGNYNGVAICETTYKVMNPPPPYGNQSTQVSSLSEQGFKEMRGQLTEGRYIVFEQAGLALTNSGSKPAQSFAVTAATAQHSDPKLRWVVHQLEAGGDQFTISSAVDGKVVASQSSGIGSEVFTVGFVPGKGYSLGVQNVKFVGVSSGGNVGMSTAVSYWKAFSVTYH